MSRSKSRWRQNSDNFRILIIGRANAGRTTVLQRVCESIDHPDIYDSAGKRVIDASVLAAARDHGVHDIEHQMMFRHNPGFVFHVSCGFEAGGYTEFDKVKAFIARRSKNKHLNNRIHAIWYCIPMDDSFFTEGEIKFFSQWDTGCIPVIVLFTKFDALYDDARAELISMGVSRNDAKAQAPQYAREVFANGPQLRLLYNRRKGNQRPSKCHIYLAHMDDDLYNADCGPLIERMAEALDDDTLKQLFVSTQRTNLKACMRYAVER
ncbi:GTP-binding protein [Suillus placidus]|uniref:GTP-binding protein n=1 Tax=Suillus placidus TaxID=48579 RepID=A0A9P7D5V3_9AGAM|nr:GTP-binding protein [Suillus placidus]